jgi:hypothetical protein
VTAERLDLKSARYDRLARSVLIDGRGLVLEVSLEALEALAKRPLSPQDAVHRAVSEAKRLTQLSKRLPPDDGKVFVSAAMLLNDGVFSREAER